MSKLAYGVGVGGDVKWLCEAAERGRVMVPIRHVGEVLYELRSAPLTGRELRQRMNSRRGRFTRWSGAAFYELMSRMEEEGWVERIREKRVIDGHEVILDCFRLA